MSCIQQIIHNRSRFSLGETKIADYLLKYPEKFKRLSSKELANILEVAQSSVVKFTQKLGYRGFTDFKLAFIEALGKQQLEERQQNIHLHNSITSHDSLQDIAEKLFIEKQKALRDTTDGINFAQLSAVITKIGTAEKIQVLAMGGSALIAKNFTYKLLKLGIPVVMEFDSHVQLTIAQSLTEKDLLIVISFSGQLREILLAVEVAKENGTPIVAITSLQHNPLHDMADYLLNTIADETRWRSSSISATTAQSTIIDLLFVGLIQKNMSINRQRIKRSQSLVSKLSNIK